MDNIKVAQECIKAIEKKIKELKQLNIIVVGKSGVGKSTLINSIFRENLAETGIGRPVTTKIRKIQKKDFPLKIYDTPGFELGGEQQRKVKDEIIDLIREGSVAKDINDAIHCVWYCIDGGGSRTFDETELAWIQELTEANKVTQVPIIVVLTQAVPKTHAQKMKAQVEKENLDIDKVVPLLAQDKNIDDEYIAKAYGLETLIDVMSEALPDELQETLQNVQKASLDAKKKYSHGIVAASVATAFGEGFAPVPFSDAALLIPTQITMIAAITAVFGLEVNTTLLTAFVSSTIGSAGATVLGKTAAKQIIKLIPGAGTLVGGAISGSAAGLMTTALGEAYIKVMEMIFTGKMDKEDLYGEKGKETMQQIFKEELGKKDNHFSIGKLIKGNQESPEKSE